VSELVLVAGCGQHTDWAIGIGEAERFSIMSDQRFNGGDYDPTDPPKVGRAGSPQVHPRFTPGSPRVDRAWFQRLKLNNDELLSSFGISLL